MDTREAIEGRLWEVCRALPSDLEPHGERPCQGRREDEPDCVTCRWFLALFRTGPDWGVCANPRSPRAGLLTFCEQGCDEVDPARSGMEL